MARILEGESIRYDATTSYRLTRFTIEDMSQYPMSPNEVIENIPALPDYYIKLDNKDFKIISIEQEEVTLVHFVPNAQGYIKNIMPTKELRRLIREEGFKVYRK